MKIFIAAPSGIVPQRLRNSTMSLMAASSAETLASRSGVEVALNPLNPRSRSQRRYLSHSNVVKGSRISPSIEPPIPSPSIHEVCFENQNFIIFINFGTQVLKQLLPTPHTLSNCPKIFLKSCFVDIWVAIHQS